MYVSMSSDAVWVVTPLNTFTLASAHACFDCKWHTLVQCSQVQYGSLPQEVHSHRLLCMCALTASIEGHGQAVNARQQLARGIPVLQRIPSILCTSDIL